MSTDTQPARTRNVLTLGQAFKLGQWTQDADLGQYESIEQVTAAAGSFLGLELTEANMKTALRITGREGEFISAKGRAKREAAKVAAVHKAAPQLLEALKAMQAMVEFELMPADTEGILRVIEQAQAAIAAAEPEEVAE